MNTQLLRTNTVHNYCKPLTSQDHLFVNHNDWILVLFPHMNWPVADENGPMLCRIEIPQYSNYGREWVQAFGATTSGIVWLGTYDWFC